MISAHKRSVVSFGTFEVDLDSGEIRKSGLRIKLQGQPFRVLAALLSRPGEVVTREELQEEIWGLNTTIDFERGIASAINKIRDALGDSADNPRYVETLAKRGYRFIAPVAVETFPHESPESASTKPTEFPAAADLVLQAPVAPVPVAHPDSVPSLALRSGPEPLVDARSRLRSHTLVALLTAALLLAALCALAIFMGARSGIYRPPRVEQLTQSSLIYSGPPNPENMLSLATDGPRIYTTVLGGGGPQIASFDLSGSQVQPISMPDELASVSIADISPDGSRLIVRSRSSRESEQSLWIVPTTGSSALRVGEVLAHDATWMPNAKGILYASGNQLGVVQLDTGTITVYATLTGRAFWPRWSPDGSTLRFTLLDPLTHTSSLWEMDAATRHPHQLTFSDLKGFSLCCGSWTADGSTYVFEASDARESNIWAIGTGARAQLTKLTNGPLRYMYPLAARAEKKLYAVGLEQPASVQLFDQKVHGFVAAPAFLSQAIRVTYSKDGKSVAWTDTAGRLWRARSADGSGRLRLTGDDLEVFLAHWSPGGHKLIMMARKPGETWQIYQVSATGGETRLVLADQRNLADPDWSPDGQQIVFGREADLMGKENGPHDIELLDLATHRTRTLPGSEGLFSPRWSPDGRWIVALSLDQTRLLLYDVQRSSWRTIFTGSAADPVWSADSQSVYFHAFAGPNPAILRVTLGGVAQPVVELSKLGLPLVANDFFSGVTPDGSPIIEPRIGSGDLYSIELPPMNTHHFWH